MEPVMRAIVMAMVLSSAAVADESPRTRPVPAYATEHGTPEEAFAARDAWCQTAQEEFARGEYQEAIQTWLMYVWLADHHPDYVVYNVAQSHRKLGQVAVAIFLFQEYARRTNNADARAKATDLANKLAHEPHVTTDREKHYLDMYHYLMAQPPNY